MLLNGSPTINLTTIGKKELNIGCPLACLLDIEQIFSRNPTISNSLSPAGRLLTLTYDYVKAIITKVQRLSGSLNAIAKNSYSIVL